ncbi:MAG: DUF262 domain-containing protein [Nitrospinales bacterium]
MSNAMDEEIKTLPQNEVTDDIIDPSEKEDDECSPTVRYEITSYGADYPVDSLVKRLQAGDILNPEFQRGFVWTRAQASRFIESLLLGLPVPGIFLSKDPETQRLFVIDGQQRLNTLRCFFEGELNAGLFKLKGVKKEFEGLTYKTLSEEDRRKLDNAIIHATIIRQEDPEHDHSSIHLVFERLNTGGTPLSAQEIRKCVYGGEFDDLISELNADSHWRALYGPQNKRAKDKELILRFFALVYDLHHYKRPMKLFLSDFMASNQHLNKFSGEELKNLFKKTIAFAIDHLGSKAFRPERALNAAITDALLVGTARRLKKGPIKNPDQYKAAYRKLIDTEKFLEKCKSATTDQENIIQRISVATEAFEQAQ